MSEDNSARLHLLGVSVKGFDDLQWGSWHHTPFLVCVLGSDERPLAVGHRHAVYLGFEYL